MKVQNIDFWHDRYSGPRCITTNGYVTQRNRNVMGKGIAAQALGRFPGVDYQLGKQIRKNENVVQIFHQDPILVAFPVKPFSVQYDGHNMVAHAKNPRKGVIYPGYLALAEIFLIMRSAYQLMLLIGRANWSEVWLPRPGCGAGGLKWEDVKDKIAPILDDRVTIIHK